MKPSNPDQKTRFPDQRDPNLKTHVSKGTPIKPYKHVSLNPNRLDTMNLWQVMGVFEPRSSKKHWCSLSLTTVDFAPQGFEFRGFGAQGQGFWNRKGLGRWVLGAGLVVNGCTELRMF